MSFSKIVIVLKFLRGPLVSKPIFVGIYYFMIVKTINLHPDVKFYQNCLKKSTVNYEKNDLVDLYRKRMFGIVCNFENRLVVWTKLSYIFLQITNKSFSWKLFSSRFIEWLLKVFKSAIERKRRRRFRRFTCGVRQFRIT